MRNKKEEKELRDRLAKAHTTGTCECCDNWSRIVVLEVLKDRIENSLVN